MEQTEMLTAKAAMLLMSKINDADNDLDKTLMVVDELGQLLAQTKEHGTDDDKTLALQVYLLSYHLIQLTEGFNILAGSDYQS